MARIVGILGFTAQASLDCHSEISAASLGGRRKGRGPSGLCLDVANSYWGPRGESRIEPLSIAEKLSSCMLRPVPKLTLGRAAVRPQSQTVKLQALQHLELSNNARSVVRHRSLYKNVCFSSYFPASAV